MTVGKSYEHKYPRGAVPGYNPANSFLTIILKFLVGVQFALSTNVEDLHDGFREEKVH